MVVANTPISPKEAPRMRHSNQERFRQQVQFLRRQFLQDGDLPFTDILTEEAIAQALATLTGWLDRIFSPLVTLWVVLLPGDVLLADSLIANLTNIVLLQARGVELVSRLNKAHRKADFRRGQRLGEDDHLVRWFKPTSIRSLDWKTYKALPEFITIRETRIRVTQPGFRTRSFVVVTTLMDAQQTTKEDLATLYRARWNNELDLRSIKSTMQMRERRCKTPEAVRKEIWAHALAYNLIRTLMAQAAAKHKVLPRSISFKGAMQTLE